MVLQELDIAAPTDLNLHDTLFPLSQGLLATWQTCRHRFQLLYLDQLALSRDPDLQERLERGQQFHLLMQQEQLGLNIADLAASEQHLDQWWQRFRSSPPTMIAGDRIAEHRRTLAQPPFLLSAIYDLLILGDRQAQIIDWKTYDRPPTAQHLQEHWQTRLYLYLLAETSTYPPHALHMTYWFASLGTAINLPYTATLHRRTQEALAEHLNALTQTMHQNFYPQLPVGSKPCRHCEFAHRCDRPTPSGETLPPAPENP
jgi:ATP-dependent exoDNAse (exonuclease V) beta subunit